MRGIVANVGGLLGATIILKGKSYEGLMPSLNDAVTVYGPGELEIVGAIVYV